MGLKDAKRTFLRAILEGRVEIESREAQSEKNLLAIGDITLDQVADLINRCKGQEYSMKILKEGDRSEGICPSCKERVPIRYHYRSVHLDKSDIDVENVLVGVCDKCGETVSIPAQSFPRLKEARENKSKTIEARVPLELDDIIRVIADHFGVSDYEFRSSLLRFYLFQLIRSESLVRRVKRLSENDLAQGKALARVSLRLNDTMWNDVSTVMRKAGIRDWSMVIRGIILAAREDVFSERALKRREDLECIAAST